MKLLVTILFILSSVMVVATQTAPAKMVFTEKDREFALKYYTETKDEYVRQLSGLSEAQLNFRAAEGRWTIAEIAEHITVVEEALFGMITNGTLKSVPPTCEKPNRVVDQMVILSITNRQQKFQAPEQVRPNGRWKTRVELLASFEKTRAATMDFILNTKIDMRNLFGNGPMGTLDAYQQFLFVSGHSERHLAQLKEVKADAKYPTK